jgi:hypothetical protein
VGQGQNDGSSLPQKSTKGAEGLIPIVVHIEIFFHPAGESFFGKQPRSPFGILCLVRLFAANPIAGFRIAPLTDLAVGNATVALTCLAESGSE